jgi:hypothetical protein
MPLPIAGKGHEAPAGPGFVWFVYGSSLDRAAFAAWAREHGYALPSFEGARVARLPDHRLAFDVVSRFWGGAVASLAPARGEVVEGLAVPMPGAARGLVDHKEGAISGLFEPAPVELVVPESGEKVAALAYRAAPARRLPADAPPSGAFLESLVRGARASGLSAGWIARLESLRAAAAAPGELR